MRLQRNPAFSDDKYLTTSKLDGFGITGIEKLAWAGMEGRQVAV